MSSFINNVRLKQWRSEYNLNTWPILLQYVHNLVDVWSNVVIMLNNDWMLIFLFHWFCWFITTQVQPCQQQPRKPFFDWSSHNTPVLEMWHSSECSDFVMKKNLEERKDWIGFD